MRNSLLISPDALRGSITHGAKDKPWEPVIRNGQTIAANSARRIVRLLTELEDYGQTPLLPTYGAPLHALYVLVVHLIRKPQARSVKSDSEVSIHNWSCLPNQLSLFQSAEPLLDWS